MAPILTSPQVMPLWHPYSCAEKGNLLNISHASGVYLYDEEGIPYLDAISSWWVNLHGHTHPHVVKAIEKQSNILEHAMFSDCSHAPAQKLASKLLEILPGNPQKVFYSDNGSTAIETALKITIQKESLENPKHPRKKVICFSGGYHGDTMGAMSVSDFMPFKAPFMSYLFESIAIPPPFPGKEKISFNALKEAIKKEDAFCFIFEPILQGVSGMRIYDFKVLDEMIKLCHEHNITTIADEVLTGFGRTGKYFASTNLVNTPQVICLAKALTGGFLPLGATIFQKGSFEIFNREPRPSFLHGHSFTANPIACASALASIELLEKEDTWKQIKMIEREHLLFCEKWTKHSKLIRCESIGVVLALEFKRQNTSYGSSFCEEMQTLFYKHNILVRPLGNVLYFIPPYCITEKELHKIYEIIEEYLCQKH